MKIKKGDKVKIIAGKGRGREGVIDRVLSKKNAVFILGLNIFKKTVKPKKEGESGGIVEVARPLNVAKVMLICPKCHKPTRIGYQLDKINKLNKIRICKKCKEAI